MSLGGGDEEQLRDACDSANGAGILLAAAAGNALPSQSYSVSFPAAYESVIAVSATNQNDELASFSCTEEEVELAAPGRDICSTVPDGEYDTLSGTSMACPHVAGAAAQVMAELGLNNSEARGNSMRLRWISIWRPRSKGTVSSMLLLRSILNKTTASKQTFTRLVEPLW